MLCRPPCVHRGRAGDHRPARPRAQPGCRGVTLTTTAGRRRHPGLGVVGGAGRADRGAALGRA
ncbi:hypothetical protein HBB16_21845 [Pseudonocardia sp. MCCB 268]|nr:hypothetical protein [Pseudonocardia cytotoxica]